MKTLDFIAALARLPNGKGKTMKSVHCILAALTVASCGASAVSKDAIEAGDSVVVVGNTFADQMRKHCYFETMVQQRFAGSGTSFRNLGWAGDTLAVRARPANFPPEDETLSQHGADVILVCFGLGEAFEGVSGLAAFRRDYQGLIDHYRSRKYNGASPPRLILVSPIAYEDLGELTPDHASMNRNLAAYAAAIGELAAANGLAFVDLHGPLRAMMSEPAPRQMTTNGIHLNQYGYWAVGQLLLAALVPSAETWRLEIDAAAPAVSKSIGVTAGDVHAVAGGLYIELDAVPWPSPPPPGEQVHEALSARCATLVAKNLADGRYALYIGGERAVTAGREAWARGVRLDTSPAHVESEAYRAKVIDKNWQSFYAWRALNQVHIVGTRKKSPSGRALPAELIEFSKLAELKEQAICALDAPAGCREWKLVAVPEERTQ